MTSIRTILAAASGGTASVGAVELGCILARRFDAHLEGYHVMADALELFRYDTGMGSGIPQTMLDKFAADVEENAARVKAQFVQAVGAHHMSLGKATPGEFTKTTGPSAAWLAETGYASTLVARRARFFDLTVLGRSERVVENLHSDAVEQTLLYSGRPILLAPAKTPTTVGERIVIGWNGSAEAVRAMTGALPLLASARDVCIVAVGDAHQTSAVSAVDYLAWHDVKARHVQVKKPASVGVGEQLLAAAREQAADMLVMGGYGHMPWREFLFGGATHDIVGISLMPLLLTH
ncbi:MAG TPA: universal stress protein [Stellaceae bacterium]|jgi:nucleotide-binding universal stress UspA family protein|nr:universal stress protein [Stellaceae bacterium]